jgi:glycosyltransferase involved in cell wall biosynthesis
MKKKKIGIILNAGFTNNISGGDIHVMNLVNALSKIHNVTVIYPESTEVQKPLKESLAKKIIIKERKIILTKKDMIKSYFYRAIRTIEILKEKDFDAIITSNNSFCDILPLPFLSKKTKIINYIFHVIPLRKGKNIGEKISNLLSKIQEKITFKIIEKKSDLILTCNNLEKKKIKKIIKNVEIDMAHIGANLKKLDKINISKKKNTALFIGRLWKQKGVYDLIKIMKKIVWKNKEFKLYLIGESSEKQKIIDEIKKEKLEKNMFILGYVNSNELIKKLKETEFFFFPSYEEGFGIVIVEALYSRSKVICYKLPHYKEFFKDFPEYVEKRDIESFVKKLKIKKDLKNQKEFVKKYEYEKRIKEDIKLIENLIKKKN